MSKRARSEHRQRRQPVRQGLAEASGSQPIADGAPAKREPVRCIL